MTKRHLGFTLASLVLASSFVGCPLLKKKATADDEEPPPVPANVDAAVVTVTGTGAKNEANVLRYASETPLPNEPAVIAQDGTVARNFPGNGPQVAVLAKGTVVAKVASYFSTGVLVMFEDPAEPSTQLLGWVSPKSFDVAAPPPTRTVFVPPRILDAGAPRAVDAGTPPARDAGGTAVVDAGGNNANTLPQPRPGQVAVAPVNGKCPDGWAVSESMCRKKCTADADCFRGTKCKQKGTAKVCTSD